MLLFNGRDVNIHHDPWSCLCFSNPTIMQVRLINFNLCGVFQSSRARMQSTAPLCAARWRGVCLRLSRLSASAPTNLYFVWKRKGEQHANHNTKQHETEATRQQQNVDSKLSTWKLVMKEAASFTEIWRVTNRIFLYVANIFWTPGPNLQPKVPPQCWHSSLHTLYVRKFAELHCHDPWSTWPHQAAGPTWWFMKRLEWPSWW